jgi:hypothetical protein
VARPGEALAEIPLETRRFEDLGRYLLETMIERVRVAEQHAGELLGGRTVWVVNSTASGGGVAQLLRTLLPYWKGAGIDVRWVVLRGSGEFFSVTKRFHNQLQGQPGDGGVLGIEELTTLDRAALYHARALASLVAPGDVVVLNDPQTAAMSEPLQRAGATVIWSCHIGIDHDNEYSWNAWRCLRPRLASVRRFVFSRYTSLPEWLGGAETSILTPGIDPGSTSPPRSSARTRPCSAVMKSSSIRAAMQNLTSRGHPGDAAHHATPAIARASKPGPGCAQMREQAPIEGIAEPAKCRQELRGGSGATRRLRGADPPHPQAGGPRRYAPTMTAPARVGADYSSVLVSRQHVGARGGRRRVGLAGGRRGRRSAQDR